MIRSLRYTAAWIPCPRPLSLIVKAVSRSHRISGLPTKMNTSMRFRRCWALKTAAARMSLVITLLPLFSFAQQNKLAVRPPTPLTIKRGTTAVENLTVEVLPGFHVNSDHPRDEYVIPLKLTWQDGPLATKSISFPKPEEIQVGNDRLLVFTGTFDIRSEFAAP